jgi:hypothetical protein
LNEATRMRKILLTLFIFAFYLTHSFAQDGLFEFTKSYFRSDPLSGQFNIFLNHLMNDPILQNKEIQKRTDTSLFYFSGTYGKYDRFFFKPRKVEILLQEQSLTYVDSIPADILFVYQLTAYADSTGSGQQEVKREFEKIHRLFNKKFHESNYRNLETEGFGTGGLHNYFVNFSTLAPLTTAWGKIKDEFVLQITLRIKTSSNRAIVAASLYDQ